MKEVYICKVYILGYTFAVLTECEAEKWVAQDPESNYYELIHVKSI